MNKYKYNKDQYINKKNDTQMERILSKYITNCANDNELLVFMSTVKCNSKIISEFIKNKLNNLINNETNHLNIIKDTKSLLNCLCLTEKYLNEKDYLNIVNILNDKLLK